MKKLMLIMALITQPCFGLIDADEAAKKSMAAKDAKLKALAASLEADMEREINKAISDGEFSAYVIVDNDCEETKKIGVGEKLSHLNYKVVYESMLHTDRCKFEASWF